MAFVLNIQQGVSGHLTSVKEGSTEIDIWGAFQIKARAFLRFSLVGADGLRVCRVSAKPCWKCGRRTHRSLSHRVGKTDAWNRK